MVFVVMVDAILAYLDYEKCSVFNSGRNFGLFELGKYGVWLICVDSCRCFQ